MDAQDKAVVEMWHRRIEFELFQPTTFAFQQQHAFFKGRVTQVPEFAAVSKQKAEKSLAWLDGVLADQPFIAGERYTVADIVALCAVDFGRVSKIKIQPDQKNLARWHGRSFGSTQRQGVKERKSQPHPTILSYF